MHADVEKEPAILVVSAEGSVTDFSKAREKKRFHSHEAIFILADVQIREKLIVDQSSLMILEPWTPGPAIVCDFKKIGLPIKGGRST